LPPVTTDNFAYAAFVYVGDTEEEGRRVGEKLLWFLNTSLKSAPQHSRFMPGTAPPEAAPQVYRDSPRPPNGAGDGGPNLTNAEKGVAPSAQRARGACVIGREEAVASSLSATRQNPPADHGVPRSAASAIQHDRPSGFMSHAEWRRHPPLRQRSPAPPQGRRWRRLKG
jgi:hypothetical protein